MDRVQIVSVDERDNNWENSNPRFRVYLHDSGAEETSGSTATYDVTGADVLQVIDWAQHQAGDSKTYAVALVYDDAYLEQLHPGTGRGLVWLIGIDGNETPSDSTTGIQQRMLARRAQPVRVPKADRMPSLVD